MEKLSIFKAILLGLLHALTGLMPLSNDAHALLLERLSGMKLTGEALLPFTLAVWVGLTLAILAGCIKRVADVIRHPFRGEGKWLLLSAVPLWGLTLLIRATGWTDAVSHSALTLLPFALLFNAIMLFLAQGIAKNRRIAQTDHDKPRFSDALAAGLMQCLSVLPGVSLLGGSLSGSLGNGLKAKRAAEFSLLACVPALLVMYLPTAVGMMKDGQMKAAVSAHGPVLLAGMVSAFVVGIAAVSLTKLAVRREKTGWFALYLALMAVVVLSLGIAGKI